MTIPHSPTEILIRRRQSLPCRRAKSLRTKDEGHNIDSSSTRKVSPVSRTRTSSSSENETEFHRVIDYAKGGTLFAAFPVELRAEIFLHFCGTYCPIDRITEGPALLLRICRAWTELTLQTPQLWTSFALDFPVNAGPKKTAFLISAMRWWIYRSRNLPLSFRLYYRNPVDATCTALMQSILPSLPRWRDATLKAPTAGLLPLWAAQPNSPPCLRTFRMETFGGSPVTVKDLGMNWTQVTELDLFLIPFPTLTECLNILKEAVHLRRCSMNAYWVLGSDELEPLSLPKLEHLQLGMYRPATGDPSPVPFLAFLHSLSLPNLQSLRIGWNVMTNATHWSNASADRFNEFLEGLDGHLETLHLAYLPLDPQQILHGLTFVPSLKCLSIALSQADRGNDYIDNQFLDALTLRPGADHGLLPMLQCIKLESNGEAFANLTLLRFIASRWKYQEPPFTGQLESLDIISPTRTAHYRPERFQDIKEGRLEVKAGLRAKSAMVQVLSCFLNKDSYGHTICFMNSDFPPDIRSLLVLG